MGCADRRLAPAGERRSGDAVGSTMPAYKNLLNPEQIWSVVSFIEAGMPTQKGP